MFTYEFMLAAALLIQPPDTPEASPPPEVFDLVRLPMQTLAVEWEILDPREVRYVLAKREDFSGDLALLRRRHAELADAPPAQDCCRFPERTAVNEFLAFNRAFRQHLDIRQPGEPARWWELRTALQETDYLYQVWDTVRDARCEYYYVTVRRQALKRLREMLGEEGYYSGRLPPYVPVWRFAQVNY
jgi:hypothetical protein